MYAAKNKDKIFINTQIKEKGKNINIFDKVNQIKKRPKDSFPRNRGREYYIHAPSC